MNAISTQDDAHGDTLTSRASVRCGTAPSAADIENDAARIRMDTVRFTHAANALLAALESQRAAKTLIQESALYGSNAMLAAANELERAAREVLTIACRDMEAVRVKS